MAGWRISIRRKGRKKAGFNCVPIWLDKADFDALEKAVKGDELPETTGCFFGETRPEHKEQDIEFIATARAAPAAPTSRERTQWYFQRYVAHLRRQERSFC
jgi:hypothetical protein